VKEAHLFRSENVGWQPHPTLPGIRLKSLQNRSVSSLASVSLVEVSAGGEIVPHSHDQAHETAYIVDGIAVLTLPSGEHALKSGDGVTVPPGTTHSLRNTGDGPCRILAVHMPPLL
jgi:mannose-6-phosphate isomerase-like protein (cupin superfamily)